MPSLSTELTRRLGIRHPVVQGGMHHVGLAPLAGAVSRAGALGMITALSLRSPELLRDEIGKARSIAGADAPVGVNLTLLPTLVPPNYQAYADVCVEERVPVIETAGHIQGLEPFVRLFKSKGAVIVHKCTQVRHARSAAKLGVDMISIDGFECAGHPGEADVGNWVLAPQAARELDVPFIVSGGVATGSQLAAALALGACGVNMGTRFMATTEAPIHDNVKRAIVQGGADSTVLVMRTMRNTERVMNNAAAREVVRLEKQFPGDFSKVKDLVAGNVYRKVFHETGDVDEGVWSAGLSIALIDSVVPVQELVDGMVAEATDIITKRLASMVAA